MAEPFLDSHLHLQMEEFEFEKNLNVFTSSLRENNVRILNIVGYDVDSSKKSFSIKFPDDFEVYHFVGIHPHYASNYTDKDIHEIEKLLDEKDCSGIGEIGIDLFWHKKDELRQQKELFIKQLNLARKKQKPVMLHVRNGYDEVLKIINDYRDLKFEFHSFSGTKEDLENIVSRGYFFGINGIITFKNNDLKNIIKKDHIERMLIETDSPYLSPVPFRGKRNRPEYVVYIYKKISELSGIDVEELKKIVKKNFYEFIGKKS
ncbi:MAG: TatD family hydrolase [candidate division WOR-3 bacterium]